MSQSSTTNDYNTRVTELLGAPLSLQDSSRANAGAGVVLSILFAVGGCALIWFAAHTITNARGRLPLWADRGESWIASILVIFFGCFLVGCGVFIWRFALRLFALQVVVCEKGFCTIEGKDLSVFAWSEIALVNEAVVHERLPIGVLAVLTPRRTTRIYTVKRNDGKEFRFGRGVLLNVNALTHSLSEAARHGSIKWEVTEKWE